MRIIQQKCSHVTSEIRLQKINFLPHQPLSRLPPALSPASGSSHCSILMKEAALLGGPCGEAHRKKLRPSVQQPVRNWGRPAATHPSRKQMDPPPAEPADETAAPSDAWHPAQSQPDPHPWRLGGDTCCLQPLSLGNMVQNREQTLATENKAVSYLKVHLRPV